MAATIGDYWYFELVTLKFPGFLGFRVVLSSLAKLRVVSGNTR